MATTPWLCMGGPELRRAVWPHFAMCQHCRRFRRQLQALGRAARRAASTFEQERPPDWEERVAQVAGRGNQRGKV